MSDQLLPEPREIAPASYVRLGLRRWFGTPRRKAASWAVALSLLVFAVVLILNYVERVGDKWFHVAAAFAAPAIYFFLFQRVSDAELTRMTREEIGSHMLGLERSLLSALRARSSARDIYQEHTGYDPRFNSDLLDDLDSSEKYHFIGATGVYIPLRVRARSPHRTPLDLRVFLVDPRNGGAVDRVVRLRRATLGREQSTTAERVRYDVLMTIVALFYECRAVADIKIGFHLMDTVSRLELLDSAVYEQPYATQHGTTFPAVSCWEPGHPAYEAGGDVISSQTTELHFHPGDDDDRLLSELRRLRFGRWRPRRPGLEEIVEKARADYEAEYVERRGEAIASLVREYRALRAKGESSPA